MGPSKILTIKWELLKILKCNDECRDTTPVNKLILIHKSLKLCVQGNSE